MTTTMDYAEKIVNPTPTRQGQWDDHAGSQPPAEEGVVARTIEQYTAQIPSDLFLWAAGASIVGSLVLHCSDRKKDATFVGQWAPTFLLLGLYNKLVKVAGSDSSHPAP